MPHFIHIHNKTNAFQSPVLVKYCHTILCRAVGFTFRKQIAPDEGLLLVQGRDSRVDSSIHMLGVWTDLAVFWINSDLEVVDKVLAKPWRPAYFSRKAARYVLEINPLRLEDYNIGDRVEFIDA
ncbi:MAG: DUF192 domain-containing protein [Anaerolineales bacterium]|nr:DUF192 domain-containing protein [Anaerolineales bacterium]